MKAVYFGIILLSTIAGIFFAPYFDFSTLAIISLFSIFFLLSLSVIPEKWLWLSMIIIAFFFFGIFRFQSYKTSLENISYPTDRKLTLNVQVVEPPEETAKATKLVVQDIEKKGRIQVVLGPFSDVSYGDYIQVEGKMATPETESLKNNLLKKGITYQMLFPSLSKEKVKGTSLEFTVKGTLFSIRNRFEDSINRIFPEPEASFMSGLLLGVKRNIPDWLTLDLQKTGTSHLIALSGFNITVIIEGLRIIFRKKSAKMSFFVPLVAILGFVVMTGAQSSVVRAGLMGAMVLLSHRVGRQSSAMMAIIVTAAMMVLLNPMILLYDIGFQLSFLAFIGIVYIAPHIKDFLPVKSTFVKELISMTLGAQVMAYPLIVFYFGTFSLISVPANFIILPFIPIIMLLGFLVAFAGLFSTAIGFVLSFSVVFALRAIISLIHIFSDLPYSAVEGLSLSSFNLIVFYILVFEVVLIYKTIKTKRLYGKKR